MRAIKSTEHKYKGFEIKGRQYNTSGGYTLHGRHYREGGIARCYFIVNGDIRYFAGSLITSLKDAKECVDRLIKKQS